MKTDGAPPEDGEGARAFQTEQLGQRMEVETM